MYQPKSNCKEALDIRKDVFVLEQKVPIDLEIDEYDRLESDAFHVLIKSEGQYAATGRITYYNKDSAKMRESRCVSHSAPKG